jgi:Pyrimidine dimer DNA glycosylase
MRIWSLHPKYLDSKGLVALWREALLAKKVLEGKTKGYKNHPQLIRFKQTKNPLSAIHKYLEQIANEAESRGYHFDSTKIWKNKKSGKIKVTAGQVKYEFRHLLNKLKGRDPERYELSKNIQQIQVHPLFSKRKGGIEKWERI